jgi:hypothetical protein
VANVEGGHLTRPPPQWRLVWLPCLRAVPPNDEQATGMEKKELSGTKDVFWSREPIVGPRGTIDKPALIPSFNDSRVVGLDTETGVCFFRLDKGPPAKVAGQFFQLQKLSDGDAH